MTNNQEKELFSILATLVTEVRVIKSDVQDIKETQNEHSQILEKHSQILEKHSEMLERLDARTDTIAKAVIDHENRLTAVEKDVADLRSGVN